jgi:hypothetical protein
MPLAAIKEPIAVITPAPLQDMQAKLNVMQAL